jgi:hypothetical protein
MPLPVTLFFTAVTAFLAWLSGRLVWTGLRNSLRTFGWRRATGTVVRFALVDGSPPVLVQGRHARSVDVAVEYSVGGVPYTTGRISALGEPRNLYYAGRTLGRMRRRFAQGARVPVYYDPAAPGDALLLRFEWGKLLVGSFFTVLLAAAAPLILWGGLTVMEPTRARETKALQALERQAPPVLAYLEAHPELGRAQHARGFWEGGPHDTPPTPLEGDWTFRLETTRGTYFIRAEDGRIVEAALSENPDGEPEWYRSLRRMVGL